MPVLAFCVRCNAVDDDDDGGGGGVFGVGVSFSILTGAEVEGRGRL